MTTANLLCVLEKKEKKKGGERKSQNRDGARRRRVISTLWSDIYLSGRNGMMIFSGRWRCLSCSDLGGGM